MKDGPNDDATVRWMVQQYDDFIDRRCTRKDKVHFNIYLEDEDSWCACP
jgi:hypothetical protein